ncbi:MAG: TIGR03032 family protein [Rhodospirillales bacterium]|nr:TIGR03032 family protein [Rhodospirillales bacterium]
MAGDGLERDAEAARGPEPGAGDQATLTIDASRQFPQWLVEHRLSLAFTTYQSGKLFFIGVKPDGRLWVHERTFNRCMGLGGDSQTLWMSSLYQLWRFENALAPGELHQTCDRLYVPQTGYTTGDIDIHDVALDRQRRPVFVATLFSCLATVSETHSLRPLWKPPFITRLAAEDRCHLNGLAMKDGVPAYVSAVAKTDVSDGWREHRDKGGVLIDVASGEIVASGFSMPHSPRLHEGVLYVHDSGTGRFGKVDPGSGNFEPIAFCPGYLRGLAFVDRFAIVGLSRPRPDTRTLKGLALDDALTEKGVSARCGILVIDLKRGDIVHRLDLRGIVQELYDVVALPGVARPMALGFKSDDIRRSLTIEDVSDAR